MMNLGRSLVASGRNSKFTPLLPEKFVNVPHSWTISLPGDDAFPASKPCSKAGKTIAAIATSPVPIMLAQKLRLFRLIFLAPYVRQKVRKCSASYSVELAGRANRAQG